MNRVQEGIITISLFVIIFLAPQFYFIFVNPNYKKTLPVIHENFFEQLIQVNATILGFTLVGIFYYLGKIDDRKKDFMNGFYYVVSFYSDYISAKNKYLDVLLEVINKPRGKNPLSHYSVKLIQNLKKQNLDSQDKKYEDLREMQKVFKDLSNYARTHAWILSSNFGFAIVLSFWCLLHFPNNGQETWGILFSIIGQMIVAVYLFYGFWNHTQNITDIIDKQTLAFTIFKSVIEKPKDDSNRSDK